jgi:hypothetical protein
MSDRELLEEYVCVQRDADQTRIMVREIHWDGPHTPVSTWVTGLELPTTATEAEVNAASANVLDDVRYFRVCQEYEQRNSVGWMDDDRICQGCAASNHGVVY